MPSKARHGPDGVKAESDNRCSGKITLFRVERWSVRATELMCQTRLAVTASVTDESQDPVRASLEEALEEYQQTRLLEAREAYDKVLNRLWAGNAGGVPSLFVLEFV
jgi:hypothetical protein